MKKLQLALSPQVYGSLSSGIEANPMGYCAPPCPCYGYCTYYDPCGADFHFI